MEISSATFKVIPKEIYYGKFAYILLQYHSKKPPIKGQMKAQFLFYKMKLMMAYLKEFFKTNTTNCLKFVKYCTLYEIKEEENKSRKTQARRDFRANKFFQSPNQTTKTLVAF